MKYTAFVTYRPTGKMMLKTDSDYKSRASFARDLRANEFIVHRVEFAEVYDFVIEEGFDTSSELTFKAARRAYKSDDLTREGFDFAMGEILMSRMREA